MPRATRRAAVGLCLLQSLAGASWVPRPLRHFTASAAAEGSAPGVQRFSHRERQDFQDGSNTELLWEVDADPDTILALDVEQEHGARMLQCWNDQLVLKVPAGHAAKVSQWRHVTASEIVHGCGHLEGRSLYHRILKVDDVRQMEGSPDSTVVVLTTKELNSPSEVFPHCKFTLRYVPAAAREYTKEPAPELPSSPSVLSPRPQSVPRRASAFFDKGAEVVHSSFTPDMSHINSVLENIDAPEEDSSMSWNWDYNANSTSNPQFKYIFPGGVGYMKLYQPYLLSHFALTINFTSQFTELLKRPDIEVVALLQGFADLNADIATAVDFQEDKGASVFEDVLDRIKLPGLPQFSLSKFKIKPIQFSMGGTPMIVNMGYRCGMKAYHIGLMKGSLRVGLSTKLHVNGIITLNQKDGVRSNVTAEALNVKFTPPTWMLFTQRFELGMILEPEFFVKGSWGDMPDMQMGLGFRPYMNISISQQTPPGMVSDMKVLAIYPFRVVGLPVGKNYAVRVGANDQFKQTKTQTSTGVIEFKDNVQGFNFGVMDETTFISGSIDVAILLDGQGDPVASGKVVCTSVVNGVCHPTPLVAKMQVEGKDVYVQLTALLQANPLGELEALVRGLTIRYPQITINSKDLAKQLEDPAAIDGVELRITRNGRKFSVPLMTKMNSNILYESLVYFELGPSFLDAWKYADSQSMDAATASILKPQVDLLVLGEVVGTGTMPPVAWDQKSDVSKLSTLRNMFSTEVSAIPLMVPLYDPKQTNVMVGTAEIEIDVAPASLGAFFVAPYQAESIPQNVPYKVEWTTHGAAEGVKYNFTLTAFTVGPNGGFQPTSWRKPLEIACSKQSRATIERYYGDVSPCVFTQEANLASEFVDKRIVFVTRWLDADYNPHEMTSEPVLVTKGRRLSGWDIKSLDSPDLHNEVRNHMSDLRSKCSARPLRYRVSAGINFVESMKNVPMMPLMLSGFGGFGGLGGSDSGATGGTDGVGGTGMDTYGYGTDGSEWTSQPVPVFKLGVGAHRHNLSSLLPASVCAGGICDGMMPGCQKTKVNPVNIKQIVFKLSRVFDLKKHLSPPMRHAIAYGLAVLPSAIKLGEKKLEEELQAEREQALEEKRREKTKTTTESTSRKSTSSTVTTTLNEKDPFEEEEAEEDALRTAGASSTTTTPAVDDNFADEDFLPPSSSTSKSKAPVEASSKVTTTEAYMDIFDDGAAARRLAPDEPVQPDLIEDGKGSLRQLTPEESAYLRSVEGDDDDEGKNVPFDTFTVRITQPMHYELSDSLMRTLIKRGAFKLEDGREATHGPIFIRDFELRDPPSVGPRVDDAVAAALDASEQTDARGTSSRFLRCTLGLVAGMAAILAAIFWAAARKHGYVRVSPSDLLVLEPREFA